VCLRWQKLADQIVAQSSVQLVRWRLLSPAWQLRGSAPRGPRFRRLTARSMPAIAPKPATSTSTRGSSQGSAGSTGGQGSVGAQGAQGAQGSQGNQGTQGARAAPGILGEFTVEGNAGPVSKANCPAGDVATGGGLDRSSSDRNVGLRRRHPRDPGASANRLAGHVLRPHLQPAGVGDLPTVGRDINRSGK
jgi:hypothetical protein